MKEQSTLLNQQIQIIQYLEYFIFVKSDGFIRPITSLEDENSCLNSQQRAILYERHDAGKLKDYTNYDEMYPNGDPLKRSQYPLEYHDIVSLIRTFYEELNNDSDEKVITLTFKKIMRLYSKHNDMVLGKFHRDKNIDKIINPTNAAIKRHEIEIEKKEIFYKFAQDFLNNNNKWINRNAFIDKIKYEFTLYYRKYEIETSKNNKTIYSQNIKTIMDIINEEQSLINSESLQNSYSSPFMFESNISIAQEIRMNYKERKKPYKYDLDKNKIHLRYTKRTLKRIEIAKNNLENDSDLKKKYSFNIKQWLIDNPELNKRVKEMIRNNKKNGG